MIYYTDGSRLDDEKVGCAYLLATQDGIIEEGQFRLIDGSTVFAIEVHAIKVAIADALRKGLGDIDIFSDSRSALQALYFLVPRHKAVVEIRDLVKSKGIKVICIELRLILITPTMSVDALAKGAATAATVKCRFLSPNAR